MRALRTLTSISRAERRLLLVALPIVAVVRLALWVLPSRAIVRATRRLANGSEHPERKRPPISRVVWAVEASSRRVPRASCLTQAVAVQLLLHWFGYSSTLCVGVAVPRTGGFRAHAWVERDGRILIGGESSRELARLEFANPATGAGAVHP